MRDQGRPWIRQEMECFLAKIKALNANVASYSLVSRDPMPAGVTPEEREEKLEAEGAARDIHAHFAIIHHFCEINPGPLKIGTKWVGSPQDRKFDAHKKS